MIFFKNCFLYYVQNCNLFIPVMSCNKKASGLCVKYKNHSFHMKTKPIWIVFKLIQTRKGILKMKTVQNVPFYWKVKKKVKTLLFIIANFIYQLLCAMVLSVWSNIHLNVAAKAFFFLMWLTFKSMNFGQSRWPPMMMVLDFNCTVFSFPGFSAAGLPYRIWTCQPP